MPIRYVAWLNTLIWFSIQDTGLDTYVFMQEKVPEINLPPPLQNDSSKVSIHNIERHGYDIIKV